MEIKNFFAWVNISALKWVKNWGKFQIEF